MPLVVTLVFVAIGALLTLNTHAEIFSCRRADYAYGSGSMNYGAPARSSEKCSLLYVTDPEYARYNAKIEPLGWALAAFLGILLPGIIGNVIGSAIVRRRSKPRSDED